MTTEHKPHSVLVDAIKLGIESYRRPGVGRDIDVYAHALLSLERLEEQYEDALRQGLIIKERVNELEEQLEAVRELNRRAEERCAEATERLRVAHRYLLEDANGETDEAWYYEALRATDITASYPASRQDA